MIHIFWILTIRITICKSVEVQFPLRSEDWSSIWSRLGSDDPTGHVEHGRVCFDIGRNKKNHEVKDKDTVVTQDIRIVRKRDLRSFDWSDIQKEKDTFLELCHGTNKIRRRRICKNNMMRSTLQILTRRSVIKKDMRRYTFMMCVFSRHRNT